MKLLGNTKELEIITENSCKKEDNYFEDSGIKSPLYETNYISGIRIIFQQAINWEKFQKNDKKEFRLGKKSNILSFVGGRGTGKTTAMNEFCDILSGMNNLKQRDWWLRHTLNEKEQKLLSHRKFYFHILNPIDASLLAEKEDLFELILANLYREFETEIHKENYGYNDSYIIRKVINDFSEISKLYWSISVHETGDYESTFISKMQFMKGSQQIQEKIEELIENLISIKKLADYEYIVIAIDDLDLNVKHGYEMLEQLQKYFLSYKIIVLVTLDYKQMQLVCEEYFWKAMANTSQCYSNKEHNRLLANDYMLKVFHLSQRMYMPEMQGISKKSQIKLPHTVFWDMQQEKNPLQIEVKKFVLLKIAEVMRIYYDACGVKTHFSEPETVRNLVSYNEFLESLEEIDYKILKAHETIKNKEEEIQNEEFLRKYNQNHERFNTDINIRMVQNLLNYEQKEAFEALQKRDLERRARYFICAKRMNDGIVFRNITADGYRYGKLLAKIHKWGEENAKGDYFLDKPFIRCILASFTSEMICEYIKYRYSPKLEDRKIYKKRLYAFLGESFSSRWIGESFSRVIAGRFHDILNRKTEMNRKYSIGISTAQNTEGDNYENNMEEKMQYCFYRCNLPSEKISFKVSLEEIQEVKHKKKKYWLIRKTVNNWLNKTQIIEILECIDMFFVRKEGEEFKGITYQFKEYKDTNSPNKQYELNEKIDSGKATNIEVLEISGGNEKVTLDIMGFVAKSMNYQTVKDTLHNNIRVGLKEFLTGYLNVKSEQRLVNEIENVIITKISEKSLFKDAICNDEIAFPYYNLDMSYNIFKRVREKYKNRVVEEKMLFDEIIGFYKEIGSLLKKQESEYEGSDNFKYAKIYNECPYIKKFNDWNNKKGNKISEALQTVFHNMMIGPNNDVSESKINN